MAFTTSGQEMEWAYSYSPGAHMGLFMEDWFLFPLVQKAYKSFKKRRSYSRKRYGTILWLVV